MAVATKPPPKDWPRIYWVDRSYEAVDLESHHWWFMQRLRGKAE